jgi:hypothetical protein
MSVRTKTVINNNIIEKVNSFNYLQYTITTSKGRDLEIKMNRFNQMCSTIQRTLNNKTRDILSRDRVTTARVRIGNQIY